MMIEVLKFWHSDLMFTVTIQKQPVDVFCKKGFLKNFVKLTGKHLWQSLFLNKLQAWGLQIYLKKDSDTGIFKNTFFIEHVWWLLLTISNTKFQLSAMNFHYCFHRIFFVWRWNAPLLFIRDKLHFCLPQQLQFKCLMNN